jgi:FkbM family methyltransferase
MISKLEAIDCLRKEGYHISRNRFTTKYLKSLNFNINTLIDIGVNQGTPDIYAAFPDSKMLLIDPQEIILKNLDEWQRKKYDIEVMQTALGSTIGRRIFYTSNISARSSFLKRKDSRRNEKITKINISMTTLDQIMAINNYKSPLGIKIDTEGYEYEILRGATNTLKNSAFIIIEISIKKRFENGGRFSEIVSILGKYGFELYDILTPLIKSPSHMDCLFIPKSSNLFMYKK